MQVIHLHCIFPLRLLAWRTIALSPEEVAQAAFEASMQKSEKDALDHKAAMSVSNQPVSARPHMQEGESCFIN